MEHFGYDFSYYSNPFLTGIKKEMPPNQIVKKFVDMAYNSFFKALPDDWDVGRPYIDKGWLGFGFHLNFFYKNLHFYYCINTTKSVESPTGTGASTQEKLRPKDWTFGTSFRSRQWIAFGRGSVWDNAKKSVKNFLTKVPKELVQIRSYNKSPTFDSDFAALCASIGAKPPSGHEIRIILPDALLPEFQKWKHLIELRTQLPISVETEKGIRLKVV
jgi:hypothetical protein